MYAADPAQETILLATLHRWAGEEFEPVHRNCALSVHAYVEEVTGLVADPSPRDLGLIAKAALWADEEALETYCAITWLALGLIGTEAPCRGDVGLLRGVADGLVAGICLGGSTRPNAPLHEGASGRPTASLHEGGGRWALRGPRGLAITGLNEGSAIARAWTFGRAAVAIGKAA